MPSTQSSSITPSNPRPSRSARSLFMGTVCLATLTLTGCTRAVSSNASRSVPLDTSTTPSQPGAADTRATQTTTSTNKGPLTDAEIRAASDRIDSEHRDWGYVDVLYAAHHEEKGWAPMSCDANNIDDDEEFPYGAEDVFDAACQPLTLETRQTLCRKDRAIYKNDLLDAVDFSIAPGDLPRSIHGTTPIAGVRDCRRQLEAIEVIETLHNIAPASSLPERPLSPQLDRALKRLYEIRHQCIQAHNKFTEREQSDEFTGKHSRCKLDPKSTHHIARSFVSFSDEAPAPTSSSFSEFHDALRNSEYTELVAKERDEVRFGVSDWWVTVTRQGFDDEIAFISVGYHSPNPPIPLYPSSTANTEGFEHHRACFGCDECEDAGGVYETVSFMTRELIAPVYASEPIVACPFVYTPGSGRDLTWEYRGEILRELHSTGLEGTQTLAIPVSPTLCEETLFRVRMTEEKREITYLDEVQLIAGDDTLSPTRCSSENKPEYCERDGVHFELHQGDVLELRFELTPSARDACIRGATQLSAHGFYIQQ